MVLRRRKRVILPIVQILDEDHNRMQHAIHIAKKITSLRAGELNTELLRRHGPQLYTMEVSDKIMLIIRKKSLLF
jgi:hypothetical protein